MGVSEPAWDATELMRYRTRALHRKVLRFDESMIKDCSDSSRVMEHEVKR